MANNNILDLEPQGIGKLGKGVQAPNVSKVANKDISQSVNNLTNTIMEISGSIIQNNKRKEIAERKDIKKQEEENMSNYNKIFKIQASEMTNANYAKMKSESEKFYDDPSAFYSEMENAYDTSYKAISDNKGLTELSKTELQTDIKKEDRTLREDFRLGVNKYNTQKVKDETDKTANGLINDIPNYAYDGDMKSAHNSLVKLAEVMKIGMELNPEEYTNKRVVQELGGLQSRYIESYLLGSVEKFKKENDLSTTEGLNNFISELNDFNKNFDAKEQRAFFNEVFKGLPFEQEDIGKKVHKMIKEQIDQQIYIAKYKKIGVEERTLQQEHKLQMKPHTALEDKGVVMNGKELNKGQLSITIGAKTNLKFNSDVKAVEYAEKNNIIISNFSTDEMTIFKKEIGAMLKLNDIDGLFEAIEKNYSFKMLDEDGLVSNDYMLEMYGKDLVEATGGLIDSNYLKVYTSNDVEAQEAYKTAIRFSNKNDMVGENRGDLSIYDLEERPFFNVKGTFDVLNDKTTYMNMNRIDVEESDRLRGLVNNYAFSNFYESILGDDEQITKYNKEKEEGKKKMINKFYNKKENIKKLNEASEIFANNYLGGNIVNVTSGEMSSKILVSDKYKDLDYNSIKENIIEHGSLLFLQPDGRVKKISPLKLRSNLIIADVGKDTIGFFYKDKQHPLKFVENGKLKNAETNLNTFTTFEKVLSQDEKIDEKIEIKKEGVKELTKEISKKVMNIRNVRNNNAGNLKEVGIAWNGKSKDTDSGGNVASGSFTKFDTPQHGVRALKKDLTTKINRGLNTITKILNVYAPNGRENDTQAYINAVSVSTGIDPNEVLDKNNMFGLVKAIISHEGGRESLAYYTDEIIEKGMGMK